MTASPDLHLATIAHGGLFWDTYVEFDDETADPTHYRARLSFRRAGDDSDSATHTTVIIIEDSYQEAIAKARALDERQLAALLRSTLPDGE